jgi:protein-S-isoprenylcysteine O-methyltransferase Ste14
MPHPSLLLFLISYVLLHSLLASLPCKAWAQRRWGAASQRWYRLTYNIVAVVTLLPLLPLLLFLPDQVLYVVPAPWAWLMLAGQVGGAYMLLSALRQTNLAWFLGTAQVQEPADDATTEARQDPLVTSGYYAYVRHPLYTAGLLMMWLSPVMTLNWLTVYVVFSLYMYIASFHEEQRLVQQFGAAYREYQQRVGRFLPRLSRIFQQ